MSRVESWLAHNAYCQEVRRRWPSIWALPVVARATRTAAAAVAPGQTVLDIGASAGRFGKKLPVGAEYLAMDVDPEVHADIRDLGDVPAASVDVVVCLETIEHLTLSDAREVAEHAARVLKPGGRLFASTPNVFHGSEYLRSATHATPFSYEELGALWLEAGLRLEGLYRCHHDALVKGLLRRLAYPFHRMLGIDYARSVLAVATRAKNATSQKN